MNARTRSRLEMARRALEFAQAHPDTSEGYTAAVRELEELLARSKQLADLQRQGIAEVRAATQRKTNLRRSISQGQMLHVATAAQRAAKEEPELAQKFALARQPTAYLAFQSLARTVAAEAEGRKALLVKHGLVDSVLVSLTESLGQFDQAQARVGGAQDPHRCSGRAGCGVGRGGPDCEGNGQPQPGPLCRDPDLLAAWKSASNVIGPRRAGGQADGGTEVPSPTPPSEGAVKPAA